MTSPLLPILGSHELRFRMNICHSDNSAKKPLPTWLKQILRDAQEKMCDEFQISPSGAFHWLTEGNPEDHAKRLCSMIATFLNIKVESYCFHPEMSFGLIIDITDPGVVEYKLKYGD